MGRKMNLNIPKRYIIVLMAFFGYLNSSYLHVNISMVIVTMTSTQQITLANGTTYNKSAEFDWDSKDKAIVLSSYNYGHFFGPIGGLLAAKFGGSTIYGLSIAGMAMFTFITPFLLKIHYVLYLLSNFSMGLFESFTFACTSQLWSRWAVPNERAKFVSFSYMGCFVAPIVSFLLAGFILKQGSWFTLYYVSGIITFIWFWIWYFVVSDSPDEDRYISDLERNYINEKIQRIPTKKLNYPWKKIFTSVPFLACCIAKFALGCGNSFAVDYIPQFVKDLSNLEIDKIGEISTIPMICMVISTLLCGFSVDQIRKKKLMSLTAIHKLYVSLGCFMGAIICVVIEFWSSITGSIVCLSVLYFFLSFAIIDVQVLYLDLAPIFAGVLNSLANVLFTFGKIYTPTMVGFVVTDHSLVQWNTCFLILGSVFLFSAGFFLKFGSGDTQPWAKYPQNEKSEENES